MAERLINTVEAAKRLGISVRSFHRYRPKLIALGLQRIRAGQRVNYRESSVDKIIKWAAENETALYEIEPS